MTEQEFNKQLKLIKWRNELIKRDEEHLPTFIVWGTSIELYVHNVYFADAASRCFPPDIGYRLKIYAGKELYYQSPCQK